MIKEFRKTLHIRLDRATQKAVKDGSKSMEWAIMEYLANNSNACDFDDVDDVIIVNERFILTNDDFEELLKGKTFIVSECKNIDDYKDWWK